MLSPNGYVQGYGYAPPPPMNAYSGGMYGGGYGYGGRMPLGQALLTAAVITQMNRGYYNGYGGGYGGFRHHHHYHGFRR
ncbi:MAG: hypothetical protein ABIP54_01730 [Candidatus Andersenbacteria bacterium]